MNKDMKEILNIIGNIVIKLDVDGNITFVNNRCYELLCVDSKDTLIGKNWFDEFLLDEDISTVKNYFNEIMLGNLKNIEFVENSIKTKDGKVREISWHNSILYDENKNIIGSLSSGEDITEKKQLQNQLKEKNDFLQNIIDGMPDPLKVIDTDYNVLLMNKEYKSKFNLEENSSIKCFVNEYGIEEPCTNCSISDIHSKTVQKELKKYIKKDNSLLYLQECITPIKNINDNKDGFIVYCTDVTKLIVTQEKLNYEKNFDPLTDLPNKVNFIQTLEKNIEKSFEDDAVFSLIILNIDNFKILNDSFGHEFGDKVLVEFSNHLKNICKKSDFLGRLNGDNFIVLLKDNENKDVAVEFFETLKKKVEDSYLEIFFNKIHMTFSAGIAVYPFDGTTIVSLLKNSDTALSEAKEDGKNKYVFYDHEFTKKSLDRVIIESSIRDAVKKEEFSLYYQPQYNSKSDTLTGMEVLIRWDNSQLGLISPDKFIPLLEDIGLIRELGYWILEDVFTTVMQWVKDKLSPGIVSINLSIIQLEDDEFVSNIKKLIQKTSCDTRFIGLEITESMLIKDTNKVIKVLNELDRMGFYISIDDFGTGYSSLSYLKKLPIKKLKIDQSFIRNVLEDKEDQILVKTMIDLAHNLGLEVIAEGVEQREQIDFLLEFGCSEIQGYYYSKALKKDNIEELLNKNIIQ